MRRLLITLPLIAGLSACSSPPEITAANAEEAIDNCYEKVDAALERAKYERNLVKTKPHLYDPLNIDWNTFTRPYLISDKWRKVTILRGYCVAKETKRSGIWTSIGYIEYVVQPRDLRESKVERVVIVGSTWDER